MKASDIRQKTPAELKTELLRLRKEQFTVRMQSGERPVEPTALHQRTAPRHRARENGAQGEA